tara:strand:+ start:594 stop:806 length:213 start_codon:yes stop_codon:yes gene_type:complete
MNIQQEKKMINNIPLKTLFDSSKYSCERVKNKDGGGSRWYFRKVAPIRAVVETKTEKPKEQKKNTFISLF